MSFNILTPTILNTYIKELFDLSNFKNITIEGEISNWKPSSVGHIYFNLKDNESIVSCNLWKQTFTNLTNSIKTELKDGTKVTLKGNVDVYVKGGRYNFVVSEINISGKGNLWIQFEQLKQKLEKEGLFSQQSKKQIKEINFNIGVITSPTGAVIEDITKTIQTRFPLAKIFLFSTVVQGTQAKESIIKNIKIANKKDLDVIILARGGGSLEDLWCFNEEEVAHAIYDSKIPIISAIGHETDFTIADFVADIRTPTPTAAATLVTPDWRKLLLDLKNKNTFLKNIIINKVNQKKLYFSELVENFTFLKNNFFNHNKEVLLKLNLSLNTILKTKLQDYSSKLNFFFHKLEDVSPHKILEKGYSITLINGKPLSNNYDEIKINSKLQTITNKLQITSIIESKEKKNEN